MTDVATGMQPVTLSLSAADGTVLRVAAAGLSVAAAPGLLVTPYYTASGPVRGRFTLTHAASGLALADAPMCPHDARAWADRAGWIGVNWQADADTVRDCGPAYLFAWRIVDEHRVCCPTCR